MTPSPFPWHVESGMAIFDANGRQVGIMANGDGDIEQAAMDAERVVACVNACAAWSTERLVEHAKGKA